MEIRLLHNGIMFLQNQFGDLDLLKGDICLRIVPW